MPPIKEWEELTIQDNFLFQKVMQNKRLCQRLIQKLLHIKVKDITYPAAEKSIVIGAVSKSVRLDLYVETDKGVILDIEMQVTAGRDGMLPHRMRYYQAMIDLEVLGKGQEYIDLKPSYVIFICTFDLFDLGQKVYTFTNRCHEENLELADGTTKMFLNAKGTKGEVDEDIEKFLAYVDGKAAEGKFTQDIAAEVERVKLHKETRLEYMTFLMELKEQRREGREEGRAEGEAKTMVKALRNLMKSMGLSKEAAMDTLGVEEELRAKIAPLL